MHAVTFGVHTIQMRQVSEEFVVQEADITSFITPLYLQLGGNVTVQQNICHCLIRV